MSKKNRPDSTPMTDTMQLEEAAEAFEPVYEGEPEEYLPMEDLPEDNPESYGKAERVLTVITHVLSALLVTGSLVFWLYYARNLAVCPIAVNNYPLYQAMLVCCAVLPLVFTVVQGLRRSRVSAEGWMVNMCVSGLVTAIIMVIYNATRLNNAFDPNDALSILCFSVSGCALPAAVYTFVLWLGRRFAASVREAASRDRETVYADVRAQSEGEF